MKNINFGGICDVMCELIAAFCRPVKLQNSWTAGTAHLVRGEIKWAQHLLGYIPNMNCNHSPLFLLVVTV